MYVVGGASTTPVALDSFVLEQMAKVDATIPTISADWISDSVKDGRRLPFEPYQVAITTKQDAARAAAEQATQEDEERKKQHALQDMPEYSYERFTPLQIGEPSCPERV